MTDQIALFIDFENIAIWAEQQFFDLELDRLMDYLRSRGAVVVKRAYGDWSRFYRYRDELLDNSIDLIQMYSVRAGKNRADIRLALDAFETAINRSQIQTVVIVSGDSDFGALASKLREYGRYIIGIGPRAATHPLLVKSCDEFVYLETVLEQEPRPMEDTTSEREEARALLQGALSAHGKRGELPILAARLKQTMLSMDSTFNEANLGYGQFRAWLEDNRDLANLFFKDLQMYVAPLDFGVPHEFKLAPTAEAEPAEGPTLAASYKSAFSKIVPADADTRRDVLRDIYRELDEHAGEWTVETLLDELHARYESKGLVRSKTLVRRIMQLGFYQRAYEYLGSVSVNTPFKLADDIESQAAFIRRAESQFVYAAVKADLQIDPEAMAATLLGDPESGGYVQELLDDMVQRGCISREDGRYRLAGRSEIPLLDDPNLQFLIQDLKAFDLPEGTGSDVETAKRHAKQGMANRSHDFAASARDYLIACRVQWDAVERQDPHASMEDLRWYLASYASVKAGDLSQNLGDFTAAQPYYLAFFSLVREDTSLWHRMRGLMNPMLSFFWRNLARELNVEMEYTTLPARLAVQMGTHPNAELQQRWWDSTKKLAQINPGVLRRVASQIMLTQADDPRAAQVASQIEAALGNSAA
jgi:hypothetical protein